MKRTIIAIALAALTIGLLGSCSKENPQRKLPEGALTGEFSVSATKKVHFSQGNLVATIDASGTPTAWKFATKQHDYLGEGGANGTIGSSAGDVDLFCWSTDAASKNWDTSLISLDTFANTTEYDEETAVKWSAMEAAGAVCLPAAGYRKGLFMYAVDDLGNYWTSSAYDDEEYASSESFLDDIIYADDYDLRYLGFSVRLIVDSE